MAKRVEKQLEFVGTSGWGGRRRGAGRPNHSGLQAHVRRPVLLSKHPVHLTLKLVAGLPSLRKRPIFKLLKASVKTARAQGFSVVHFSIQGNHMHFMLEPQSGSLAKCIQSLTISFARRLNAHLQRKGSVFLERYHLHVLKTPTEVKRVLAYILSNDSKHLKLSQKVIPLSPFSSAHAFVSRDWKVLFRERFLFSSTEWPDEIIESWYDEIMVKPKSWLAREGWKKAVA